MSDNRPSRYIEVDDVTGEEVVVYRASGLGGCVRAMVASARGHQPKAHADWFVKVLDEGTRMEAEILRQFAERSGVELVDTQPEVELEIGCIAGRRVIVRGHMDGIGADTTAGVAGGQLWVVEAKKFRASTYPAFLQKKVEVNNYYPWQLSAYMHATGLPAKFVGGAYEPAVEPDADGKSCDESIRTVEWASYLDAPISLPVIKARVAKVERLIGEGYGPDEVECVGSYPCPFFYLHDDKPVDEVVELDAPRLKVTVADWHDTAARIKEHQAHIKKLEAKKKAAAEELRGVIVAAGKTDASKFRVGEHVVTWVRSHVAEKVSKAYELDYFTVKESATREDQA